MSDDTLPRAWVPGWRRAFEGIPRLALRAAAVSVPVALAYTLTLAGCENKAITYAQTVDPGNHCSAVSTSWSGSRESADVAICRTPDGRVIRCKYDFSNDTVGCTAP